jgi:hypothetical protein
MRISAEALAAISAVAVAPDDRARVASQLAARFPRTTS